MSLFLKTFAESIWVKVNSTYNRELTTQEKAKIDQSISTELAKSYRL